MAHWQLGRVEEARRWYDQAEHSMQEKPPQHGELAGFRAEAAELLGAADAPPEEPESSEDAASPSEAAATRDEPND